MFRNDRRAGSSRCYRVYKPADVHSLRRARHERHHRIRGSHHLEEAEHCDQIAIIDGGNLVAQGSPNELKAVVGNDLLILRTGDDETAAKSIEERFGIIPQVGAEGIKFRVADGSTFVPTLCAELGVPVQAISVTAPSLDAVFLHYTGRDIRETESGRLTLKTVVRG